MLSASHNALRGSLAPPLHRTAAGRKPSRLQRGGTTRCQALSEDARDVTAGGRAASGRPPRSVKELTAVQTELCDPETSSCIVLQNQNMYERLGGEEREWVELQAAKALEDEERGRIAMALPAFPVGADTVDVAVVGCGPAGLALAAQLGVRGLSVALLGPDLPFVNNYGVWVEEMEALGFDETVFEAMWPRALTYFSTDEPVVVNRRYARVDRHELCRELLRRCAAGGVRFRATAVEDVEQTTPRMSTLRCEDGGEVTARLVVVAAGAAGLGFIDYEESDSAEVASQTAYGVEVECEGYPFSATDMLFMDYRRMHTGDAAGTSAQQLLESAPTDEVPSFLYAMPSSKTHVFLEETCLATRPGMPFEELKARLMRRCDTLGIKITKIIEEEWSHIPLGGPLPKGKQAHFGFGAAANLVHPATGYSILRSLSEAPAVADTIVARLREQQQEEASAVASFEMQTSASVAEAAWGTLWSDERRRQSSFQVFGMELLADLNLREMSQFFDTFFVLPERLSRGFLAAELSSGDLCLFAFVFFLKAPNAMRFRLLKHLATHPSGSFLINTYIQTLIFKRKAEPALL